MLQGLTMRLEPDGLPGQLHSILRTLHCSYCFPWPSNCRRPGIGSSFSA